MPLTPADVHNVAFSKPPIGKRGYNEDEVDAFLDLVENELTRLIEENADLRQRVGELDQELASARAGGGVQAAQAIPLYQHRARAGAVAEPVQAARRTRRRRAQPAAPGAKRRTSRAARVLALAQETADRLTGSAQGRVRQAARPTPGPTPTRCVSEAQAHRRDHGRRCPRSGPTPCSSDAQTRSETQLRQAQEKADALQADAERKHAEIMGTINQQRTVLEGRLEQLRTFEREYRTRLKTYLESQLEELGQRGSAAPVDSAGNEAGFNQFNRGNN